MSRWGRIARLSFGAILLAGGLWLILSGKSILHLLPLPEMEIGHCRIPGTGAVIRLYEGNLGATTSYWYTVTYQQNYFASEQTIFSSYGEPWYMGMNCQPAEAELIPPSGDFKPYVIPYDVIQGNLVRDPISFHDGNAGKVGPSGPIDRVVKILFGACILPFGFRLLRSRRSSKEYHHRA